MNTARTPIDEAKLRELQLRVRLRGAQLVLEMGIDVQLRDDLRLLVTELGRMRRDADSIGRDFPALLVTYLVAEGLFSYDAGDYWSGVCAPLGGHDGQVSGRRFEDALARLGLESFEHLTEPGVAHARVGKILAHGGIPLYCLRDFFGLVIDDVARGLTDPSEMLATWRESTWRLSVVSKPTQRFLLNGGELAADFLGRCIDLIIESAARGSTPSADEAGLPGYVIDAFEALPAPRERIRAAGAARAPRPAVLLDPWSHLGPVIELPAVSPHADYPSWTVEDGLTVVRRDGSVMASERVPLAPARTWECEYRTADDARRRFVFEGLARMPALLFDPATGRMLRDPTTASLDAVWIVAPEDAELRQVSGDPVAVSEEFPRLSGRWAGYVGRQVVLGGVTSIVLTHEGRDHSIRVVRRPHPTLDGTAVRGVTGDAGEMVFSAPPVLSLPDAGGAGWRGRLLTGHSEQSLTTEELGSGKVDLADSLPGGVVAAELVLRGPLGSDTRLAFYVVPGLTLTGPRGRLLTTRDGAVALHASAADGVSLDPATPVVEASSDRVRVTAISPNRPSVGLIARIPRLQWGLAAATSGAARLGGDQINLDVVDLTDGVPTILDVRTGRPGSRLRLRLVRRGETVAETPEVTAPRGRWSFDLDGFGDTVKNSKEQFLVVVVDADDVSLPVARIAREHQVWGLRLVDARWDSDGGHLEVGFNENQPFNSRVLRLWPRWRAWEGALTAPIPDGTTGLASLSAPGLRPGDYLVQIAVGDDDWVVPRRPYRTGAGIFALRLGGADAISESLSNLDPESALGALELARADGRRSPGLGLVSQQGRTTAIAQAALDAVAALPRGVPRDPPLTTLSELLAESPQDALRALAELILTDRAHRALLARLAVRVLGVLRAEGPEPIEDDAMNALWASVPVLAATADLPAAAGGDESANRRCDRALGWSPEQGVEPPPDGGADAAMLRMARERLEALRSWLERLPSRQLDIGIYGPANLDWMIAQARANGDRAGHLSPARWWERWEHLVGEPLGAQPCGLSERVDASMARRAPPEGAPEWMGLPQLSLAAAAHLVAGSVHADQAAGALDEGLSLCPRLVVSDLVRAQVFDELPVPSRSEHRA